MYASLRRSIQIFHSAKDGGLGRALAFTVTNPVAEKAGDDEEGSVYQIHNRRRRWFQTQTLLMSVHVATNPSPDEEQGKKCTLVV